MKWTECGSYIAPVYFVSFIVIVAFIILNVFIAVILEHFEASMNEETNNKLSIKEKDVLSFDESWGRFIDKPYKWYKSIFRNDNDKHLWIRVQDLEVMLLRTEGLFGIKNKNWTRLERFKLSFLA